MAKIDVPRYFVEKKGKNGKPSRYYWQPGKELAEDGWQTRRLSAELETAIAEAKAINDGLDKWRSGEASDVSQGPTPGSIDALIAAYKKQPKWTGDGNPEHVLSDKTKDDYRLNFKQISAWCGDAPVASLTRRAVLAKYEAMQPVKPAAANAFLRALRLLLQFGVDKGWIAHNPAEKPGMIGTKPRDIIWSQRAVTTIVEAADRFGRPSIGATILMGYNLGQREGDLLGMPKSKFVDGRFRFKQNKTGAWVYVPATRELLARLETNAVDNDAQIAATTIIVSEETGRPYAEDNFQKLFAKIRGAAIERQQAKVEQLLGDNLKPLLLELAAIKDSEERLQICQVNALPKDVIAEIELLLELGHLQFMDLRRTAVVRLGEAGCTEAQIASISGHSIETTRQILETYLPRTTAMAEAAIEKLEAWRDKLAGKEGA